MKNLIVCCDGTWQTADQQEHGVPMPSNVVRLYNALADNDGKGNAQLKYYHPGVGTEGSWWQKTLGGSVGAGLGNNIKSAYRWLGVNYEPGDKIYLFGFSRGAYTVRSLGGMIGAAGLLNLAGLTDKDAWARVDAAYEKAYRARKGRAALSKDWAFYPVDPATGLLPVWFIGVWDTVGALGIPDDLSIVNFLLDRRDYTFHDTTLGAHVIHARHALALDECRASFTPTRWVNLAPGRGTSSKSGFLAVIATWGAATSKPGFRTVLCSG